jgi:hypothetical protein
LSGPTTGSRARLVQDGVTGVTVILPREPGLLVRARLAARAAGVEVRADQIDSATITLRFRRGPAVGSRPWPRLERGRRGWLPF